MRAIPAVMVAVFCLVLAGCDDASRDTSDADDRPVTFRGTAEARSMEPTLMVGDRIIATEVDASGPVLGDVVVYRNPGNWLAFKDAGEGQLVHRVIGTPGDMLVCCDADGRISVNASPIDEPYVAPGGAGCDAVIFEGMLEGRGPLFRGPCDWTIGPVPDGMLFVMGDNRDNSADSRFHLCPPGQDSCSDGPWVPIDLVIGRVELPPPVRQVMTLSLGINAHSSA